MQNKISYHSLSKDPVTDTVITVRNDRMVFFIHISRGFENISILCYPPHLICLFPFHQELHKYKENEKDTEVLMSALSAMQDKTQHLENSLSAETRIKLDLFSALGDAKRQLEIAQGQPFFRTLASSLRQFFTGGTIFMKYALHMV